jgi:hypothetical protein
MTFMFFIHCFFALFARNKKFHAKAAKVSHAEYAKMSLEAIAKNLSAPTDPSLRYASLRMTIQTVQQFNDSTNKQFND